MELNMQNCLYRSEELETGLGISSYILDCTSLIYTLYSTVAVLQINVHNNYSVSKAEKNTYFKCLKCCFLKKWSTAL